MEADYYVHLLSLAKEGIVKEIVRQPVYLLIPKFSKNGRTIRKTEYKADFLVTYADGSQLVVDVKGAQTDVFRLKHKLFDLNYPDLALQLITAYKGQWIELKNKPKSNKKGRTPRKSGVNRRVKKKRNL
jgi:hypothetical protein